MRIIIAFLRVTFGVVLALLLVEVLFRLLAGAPLRWTDRPKEFYLPENAPSLQDAYYPDVKPADTFRIVVVGDSFTFGPHLQYDDTFSKRLERWFNLNSSQRRVEVVNAGVSGYSTRHEVELVKKAVEQQQADLVLLELTLNDAELGPLTAERQKELYAAPYLKKPIFKYWKSARFFLERIHNSQTHRLYKQYFFDLYDSPTTFSVFTKSLQQIAAISQNSKVPVFDRNFPAF